MLGSPPPIVPIGLPNSYILNKGTVDPRTPGQLHGLDLSGPESLVSQCIHGY
jgi:hypothetical protein